MCTFTGSISFRGWCFSSRRRFLFRLYLISSDDFAGSLSGVRRLLLSRLLASHPYPEGGRERAPRLFFRFQKPSPIRVPRRPIQTVRVITASPSDLCAHPRSTSFVSAREERKRGSEVHAVAWNPWREWNPREYPSGHALHSQACRGRALLMRRAIDRDALIDNRMSVNRSSAAPRFPRLERGARPLPEWKINRVNG